MVSEILTTYKDFIDNRLANSLKIELVDVREKMTCENYETDLEQIYTDNSFLS